LGRRGREGLGGARKVDDLCERAANVDGDVGDGLDVVREVDAPGVAGLGLAPRASEASEPVGHEVMRPESRGRGRAALRCGGGGGRSGRVHVACAGGAETARSAP
jgi:hypothetical protein